MKDNTVDTSADHFDYFAKVFENCVFKLLKLKCEEVITATGYMGSDDYTGYAYGEFQFKTDADLTYDVDFSVRVIETGLGPNVSYEFKAIINDNVIESEIICDVENDDINDVMNEIGVYIYNNIN